ELGRTMSLYTREGYRMGRGRGLLGLAAAATGMVVLTLPAPAMALTVTTRSGRAPLPAELPLGDSTLSGSVSGGPDGASIAVTVTGPAPTGVEIQVPPV